ncbi:MAG: DEAD/DEAH box helicase [Acidimicrobiia bacterium]
MRTAVALDPAAALAEVLADPFLSQRVVHREHFPARAATPGDIPADLPPTVTAALERRGISGLWSHQSEAVDHVRARRSVVVATGTASGKSLAYQVPILEQLLAGGGATSMAVFPTKALARDQLRRLRELAGASVSAAVVDGDTPHEEREWARKQARVLFTNPDMLHRTILPSHHRWAQFLSRLALVAVDEIHTLRGIFGSHVAHVLARLRRLAAHYGAEPAFVCTTATLANPRDLARRLTGVPVRAVVDDGSPRPERLVALWNPPLVDPDAGVRQSPVGEAGRLLARLVETGLQTLVFARSRRAAEMVAIAARDALTPGRRAALGSEIVAYRGGFLADERREIEDGLAAGRLRGVAATNALELGMDVCGLDVVVMCGFPGTVASFRQQLGRAGRTGRSAGAVLIAGQDQLDQWYLSHPDELFGRPPEAAVICPQNPSIDEPHLACAAAELPLRRREPALGDDLDVRPATLLAEGTLAMRRRRLHYVGRAPARFVALRSSSPDTVRIVDDDRDRVIGTVESANACRLVHPGAVYLHQGESWLVRDLDLDDNIARAVRFDCDYFTEPRTHSSVEVVREDEVAAVGPAGVTLGLGDVEVTSHVVGFRMRVHDADAPGPRRSPMERLDLPPQHLVTRAFWYSVPEECLAAAGIDTARVPGTVHACEHTGIGILPRFAICDRWDLGGLSTPSHHHTGTATWFVYDAYPGGAGLAEAGFACGLEHVRAAWAVIESCGCAAGCPGWVHSPKCGNWNEPLDKAGAAALLAAILGQPASRSVHSLAAASA